MATYYFLNTNANYDWDDGGNWNTDSGGSGSSGTVPTTGDEAIIPVTYTCNVSSVGGYKEVANLIIYGSFTNNVTVTSLCTVDGGTLDNSTIVGNCVGDNSAVISNCIIYGNLDIANYTRVFSSTITGNVGVDSYANISENNDGMSSVTTVIGQDLIFYGSGTASQDAMTGYDIVDVPSGNVVISSGCASTIYGLSVTGALIYQSGYSATVNFAAGPGSTLYSGYPVLYYWNTGSTGVANEWNDTLNWWINDTYTQQSYHVPSSTTIANIYQSVYSDSSSSATADTINMEGALNEIGISITVATSANFNDIGGIPGTGTFLSSTGTINGNANFFGGSTTYSNGTINGDAHFFGSTYSSGTINGSGLFYNNANNNGNINGTGSFFDNSTHTGTINGNAIVTYPHIAPFFPNTGNNGVITGSISYVGYSQQTLYFYSTVSSEWSDSGNWWSNSSYTTPASLPLSSDHIIIDSEINSNIYPYLASVEAITVNANLNIDITCVSGEFNNTAIYGSGTLSTSSGIKFLDLSSVGTSVNTSPIISGNAQFEDNSSHYGTINGDATVYYPVSIPLNGTVNGTTTYVGYSLYFNDSVSNDGDWNNSANWYIDFSGVPANSIPTDIFPGTSVILQSNVSSPTVPTGTSPTAYDLLCSGYVVSIPIIVYGLATFAGSTGILYNSGGSAGEIIGNVIFTDIARPQGGIIQGTTTFTLSAASGTISDPFGGGTFNSGIYFQYGKGVNGSNILGIV